MFMLSRRCLFVFLNSQKQLQKENTTMLVYIWSFKSLCLLNLRDFCLTNLKLVKTPKPKSNTLTCRKKYQIY
jgi:hypothetical protein